MKNQILSTLSSYLEIFPNEVNRQKILMEYLSKNDNEQIIDWNNFNGHLVATGFIYSKKDKKFLVLYHKDLKMYLFPGGHIDPNDKTPLEAAKREVEEETGLKENLLNLVGDALVPIDIDTHIIEYNERRNLPAHYHFDFRYLFTIDEIENINIDEEEHNDYKWIDINELAKDSNYKTVISKIEEYLNW